MMVTLRRVAYPALRPIKREKHQKQCAHSLMAYCRQCHTRHHHRVGNAVCACADGKCQDSSELRKAEGEAETVSSFRNTRPILYPVQVKTVGVQSNSIDPRLPH